MGENAFLRERSDAVLIVFVRADKTLSCERTLAEAVKIQLGGKAVVDARPGAAARSEKTGEPGTKRR